MRRAPSRAPTPSFRPHALAPRQRGIVSYKYNTHYPLAKTHRFATLNTSQETDHRMRPDTHATFEVETPPVATRGPGAGWVVPVARRRRLGPASGPFLQLTPGLPGGLPRSAVWVATATARVPTANRIPGTSRTVFPWVPNLEKSISGVQKCTEVHGGVLRSPGSPPLGGLARASQPWKLKSGEVLVQFRCSFHPAGRLGRLALPGTRLKPVTKRDKTRQNATNRAIPGSGNSESLRSALTFFCKTVRFGAGFRLVPVQKWCAKMPRGGARVRGCSTAWS